MSLAKEPQKPGPACLAVDLGAGSGRLVSGRVRGGRFELTEVGRFRTPTYTDAATGYQCWGTNEILEEIQRALALYPSQSSIASVGVDSWGVDYVLLDDELRQVGAPVSYRDKRTTGIMERVQEHVSREEIYRRTGIQFLSFNTLFQLAACVERQPEWIRAARHLLMIPDYFHFRLSGVLSNEYTNATTTQMYGLNDEWDEVLSGAIGLKQVLMERPVAAGTVLGELRLNPGGAKVIAPATHDTASAVAGIPLESKDEAYICSGTWSLMGIESAIPIASAEAMRLNFTNEGGLERRYRVLKNIMGMWPIQRLCDEHGVADVGALVAKAAESEPWRFIIDLDEPEFLNPASMTDSIRAYCRCTQQPVPAGIVDLTRCVFDSLALTYRRVKEEIETLRGQKLSRIRIVGGGCQNRLLNQLCADACELPVVAGPVEASVLGNLSAQMIALGEIENLVGARKLIRASCELMEYLPRATVSGQIYKHFQQLHSKRRQEGEHCA
jgi:rhamnulokinase